MIGRVLLLAAVLFSSAVAAQATRKIPADAPKGRFSPLQFPLVAIDGRQFRLAPGARIFTADNRTVTPGLVAAGTWVRYELDAEGQVRTVWIVEATPGVERSGPQR